jgi:CubicO group peptidase (beta-lactamase class C family)
MALSVTIPVSRGETQSVQQLSKAAVVARVDSMARAYMAEKGPASMSVAITRGDDTLVMKAWGLADLDANRPATAANTYQIGSISKQFTAVLLLKQVERGKLALTDSIGAYLTTGLRPEWRPLTIEQLLNHTSGMQNDLKREGPKGNDVPADTMIAWAGARHDGLRTRHALRLLQRRVPAARRARREAVRQAVRRGIARRDRASARAPDSRLVH